MTAPTVPSPRALYSPLSFPTISAPLLNFLRWPNFCQDPDRYVQYFTEILCYKIKKCPLFTFFFITFLIIHTTTNATLHVKAVNLVEKWEGGQKGTQGSPLSPHAHLWECVLGDL